MQRVDQSLSDRILTCHRCPLFKVLRPHGALCSASGGPASACWESGKCPHPAGSQFETSTPIRRKPQMRFGPGDVLAGAVKVVTLGAVGMCPKCRSRRAKMNAWGWRGCLLHPIRLALLFTSGKSTSSR